VKLKYQKPVEIDVLFKAYLMAPLSCRSKLAGQVLLNFLILEKLTETHFIIPFSVIGRFSPLSAFHWMQEKAAKIQFT
jgi:hypothetical protein